MERMKITPFICLFGLLLLGGCSSIERGVVVAKGQRQNTSVYPPIDYYWVDVRGENRGGRQVTERVQLFKPDWSDFKKGDRISPHDYDMIGVARALGFSLKGKAEAVATRTPKPALRKSPPPAAARKAATPRPRTAHESEAVRTARFRDVEARALEDTGVRESKEKIYSAKTDDEQTAAYREYRSALYRKMREMAPTLKDRIDQAESAQGQR